MSDLAEMPGMAEALEAEATLRELAFLDVPVTLCGVDVNALTPRHVLLLNGSGSPFMKGGIPTPSDVAAFLWVISPQFIVGNGWRSRWRRRALCRAIRKVHYAEAVKEIRDWIDGQLMDAPSGKGDDNDAPVAAMQASFVDCFGSEYGWTWRETMDTPIAILFQLHRMIIRRNDPKKHFSNRYSDRVLADYLRAKNSTNN